MAKFEHFHPDVQAEYLARRDADPVACSWPSGVVHWTAAHPKPHWCARPRDHVGAHMPKDRYSEYRALATARQQRKRARDSED